MIKKMNEQTDNKNRTNFLNLLPDFFYSEESQERLEKITNKESTEHFLPLYNFNAAFDSTDRAWYDITNHVSNSRAWEKFKSAIVYYPLSTKYYRSDYKSYFTLECWSHKCDCQATITITEQDFLNNKFQGCKELDMPAGKLFKALLKYDLIRQDQIDDINKVKTGSEKLYLCISRNPIDFLFASTNQPFSSCLNLESTYEAAYYMSLPAMLVDPTRFIVFITNGKLATHHIHNYEFKHFKYIQRSWGLIDTDGYMFIERAYPEKKVDIEKLFTSLKLDWSKEIGVMKSFHPCTFEDGQKACIYLDNVQIKISKKDGSWRYEVGSTGGNRSPEFNYTGGFEALEYFEGLNEQYSCCSQCDNEIRNPDDEYRHNGNIYCERCYDDLDRCYDCGEITSDLVTTCSHTVICHGCAEVASICAHCERPIERDDATRELHDGRVVGWNCRHRTTVCDNCRGRFLDDDVNINEDNGNYYCDECFANIPREQEQIEEPVQEKNALLVMATLEQALSNHINFLRSVSPTPQNELYTWINTNHEPRINMTLTPERIFTPIPRVRRLEIAMDNEFETE